ncbi:RHS repeat-associated core domain-containing protein [Morganella morganii]|uniref:RHS repeat-associated core domain-containing protein n=1 Tax=Morganella morganii TaxID=582 RepID=UPI003F511D77
MIEEVPVYADGTVAYDAGVQWLYEPGALVPAARYEKGKLHYLVTDHQGTPREIFTESGTVSWAARPGTWGQMAFWSLKTSANDPNYTECHFRFAGQYEDAETGLYYNRFRYYDKDTGQYISPDPIGLLGGLNPYGYVHNPTVFIDPLGLCGGRGNKGEPKDILTYRGDTRGPDVIFEDGFKTLGPSKDLQKHAFDNRTPPSDFVSTTTDPTKTIGFATKYGQVDGYMYTMKTNHGIDVNKVLGSKSPYPAEAEIAMPGGVKTENILGVTPIKANGEIGNYSILNPKRYGK